MRRLKLLGLALVAVFASAAMLSASAFAALPVNLPESGTGRTWTGANDGSGTTAEATLLSTAGTVKCPEAPATGNEEAGKPLGLFHIEFRGCHATIGGIVIKCTGLDDLTAGVILSLGTWHLVFDKLGTGEELKVAVLFLPEHTHFSCGAFTLILVLGALVCLHLKPTESNVTHLFHCIVNEVGGVNVQEDTTYYDNNGNAVTAELLCSVNEAAEKPCFELALGSVTYGTAIFADI